MRYSILAHITAAILVSLIMLLIYATVQQTYRTEANDPQLEITQDLSHNIQYSRTCHYLPNNIDPQQSLSTFVQFYNTNGKLIYSGGTISGKVPGIPKGVLDNTKQNHTNNITWQPASQIRLAAVAAYTGRQDTAYVVVVRSLQEVESREANLVKTIVLFWVVGMAIIALHWLIQNKVNTGGCILQ